MTIDPVTVEQRWYWSPSQPHGKGADESLLPCTSRDG